MALIIAGERSGVGKTTVTLALLACMRRWGRSVQSFKVGPDYIDPMFHTHVTGRTCRNLDPVLTSEEYVRNCFDRHSQTATHALIEGVMGLFDGAAGRADFASTAHVARLLQLPILLVLDCSRLSHSIAALVHGYRSFDPRIRIAGVVLNRVGSDRHLQLLQAALEPLQIPVMGVLRRQEALSIPDRHLGLVPTAELAHLQDLIDRLADVGATSFDWQALWPLLEHKRRTSTNTELPGIERASGVRVAIAQDAAFSFYYADNLERLAQLGAELVPWSPLQDATLPGTIQGLYLGGGFPEMFAAALAANRTARQSVRSAIQSGLPTYAECGGLMYLCEALTTFAGETWPMAGVLPTTAVMGPRLTLGYRQATPLQDGLMLPQGMTVWGHEFHRSHLMQPPEPPLFAVLPTGDRAATWEGWYRPHLHASYIHLHWGAHPALPARFLQHCRLVQARR